MRIEYERYFLKDLKNIKDTHLKLRIEEAILELKQTSKLETISSIIKMKGNKSAYRQRVDDYRIGFYLLIKENEMVDSFIKASP